MPSVAILVFERNRRQAPPAPGVSESLAAGSLGSAMALSRHPLLKQNRAHDRLDRGSGSATIEEVCGLTHTEAPQV